MTRWMLALVVAGVGTLGYVHAGGYGYGGGCCDPCCSPCCDPCCDPCCQPCNPCCDPCCDPCWDPCCDPCWCGGFEVIGEFLYIRPHMCDLNYAIEDNTAFAAYPLNALAVIQTEASDIALPIGKEHGICPDYEAAFRVGLGYLFNCGCNDITVTFTRLCTTEHSHVAAQGDGGLWATYGHPRFMQLRLNNPGFVSNFTSLDGVALPAEAKERARIEYNMVDGVVATRTMKGCDLWLRGYAGIRWAQICVNKCVDYQGSVASFFIANDGAGVANAQQFAGNLRSDPHSRAEVWGVGPRVGMDLRYDIACGFGLGAHVGASLLVGEACYRFAQDINYSDIEYSPVFAAQLPLTTDFPFTDLNETAFNAPVSVHSNSHCHLIPEIDARLGLNYLFCCGDCFSLLIEVGWEFVSYINAIARVAFDDETGHGREVCESYNMDGLYASFKLSI
jgi:hypothetical protein